MPGSDSHFPTRKTRNPLEEHTLWSALSSLPRLWRQSYGPEYLGLAILLTAYLLLQFLMEPFHRMFSISDPRISYPHAEVERVPVFMLFAYAGGLPLLILLLWTAVIRPDIHKTHSIIFGLLVSIVLTLFLTDVFKNAVGRPRPDLLERCKAEAGTPSGQLVTVDVCTETDSHLLHDGWRSFPSGHSSFAFSGLGYLGIFFISQLHVLRPKADLARVLLALAPFVGAAMIAVSRLEDYRHDVFDIVAGSTLGACVAYATWRRHFPPLSSPGCADPYPSQTEDASSAAGFSRVRDEEELVGNARAFELDDEDRYSLSAQRNIA